MLEQAAVALLTYIEDKPEGFRILVRDSPVASSSGNFASLLSDIASQVEHIVANEFKNLDFDVDTATALVTNSRARSLYERKGFGGEYIRYVLPL